MEKAAQTPNGAPHRRRRRRPAGNGSAPQAQQPAREGKAPAQPRKPAPQAAAPAAPKAPRSENAPRANGSHPRRGQGRPAQPQSQQAPRQNAPAQRPAAPQNAPQSARPAAPQPPRRNARPAPRSTAPEQPGLDLISRRPPKQKFANFEDYLAAHGGMTVPLPPEASDAADTPETATPAEAAE